MWKNTEKMLQKLQNSTFTLEFSLQLLSVPSKRQRIGDQPRDVIVFFSSIKETEMKFCFSFSKPHMLGLATDTLLQDLNRLLRKKDAK